MSDNRNIRVDVLQAAIEGVAAGAVIAVLTGQMNKDGAKAISVTLETLSDNIDALVERSAELDLEDSVRTEN